MVRYADKYDPDLAAAFEKLERGLPPPLARARRADARRPVEGARATSGSRHVRLLTKAWAERRVVTHRLRAGQLRARRRRRARATVRPYLLEPSLQTHALYLMGFDEARDAIRTFKVERIATGADAAHVRAARPGGTSRRRSGGLGHHRRPAPGRGRAALRAGVAQPRPRGDLASDPAVETEADGSLAGGPRSRARSRSGSGSCRGATMSRSSRRRRCATTWPTRSGGRPRTR